DGAAKSEAKSDSEAKPRAEAKERNIGRSPDRTIVRIPVRRTRPPSPTSVHIHPAAVVIRSPAPIIVGNPGPSPIRFINPAPVAVRSPIRWHGRTPHLTVIRNLRPGAVPIKILRAHVIIVGLLAPFRVADHVVAIAVPLVKVVARGRFPNLVLLVCTRTLNGDELVLSHPRTALRSGHFDFALPYQNFRVIVRRNQNAKARFAPLGANGYVGSIDFSVGIATFEYRVVRHAMSKLNLDLRARELHQVRLAVLGQPKRVGIVEFQFSPRLVSGRNPVTRQHGSIQHRRRPILRVAALRRYVAMNQTHAGHAILLLRRRRVVTRIGGVGVARSRVHRPLTHRPLIPWIPVRRIPPRLGIRFLSLILIHRPLVVRTLHLNIGRRLRILIRSLAVLILSHNGDWDRHHHSKNCRYEFELHHYPPPLRDTAYACNNACGMPTPDKNEYSRKQLIFINLREAGWRERKRDGRVPVARFNQGGGFRPVLLK